MSKCRCALSAVFSAVSWPSSVVCQGISTCDEARHVSNTLLLGRLSQMPCRMRLVKDIISHNALLIAHLSTVFAPLAAKYSCTCPVVKPFTTA
jgi:hypothetical protein